MVLSVCEESLRQKDSTLRRSARVRLPSVPLSGIVEESDIGSVVLIAKIPLCFLMKLKATRNGSES
jgi:hypothetical protein